MATGKPGAIFRPLGDHCLSGGRGRLRRCYCVSRGFPAGWGCMMASKRKADRKGRSASVPPFVQLPWWIVDCSAYRALKPVARALLIELIRRYNGHNNGHIGLGEREAADALGMRDRVPVRKQFADLEAKGFIRCMWRGAFAVKAGRQRASEWWLTWLPHASGTPATKDFMRWKPEGHEQNSRDRFSDSAGQETCPEASPKGAKSGLAGQETCPGTRDCKGHSGQETYPHIDMP